MSSIAYITDQRMIEFHRLNGNDGINFWRPSAGKRFSDFNSGDLLFFLAKGTEKEQSKEKGVIGYGRYTYSESLSCKQMWTRYETLNGYSSELELKEGILKVSKTKTLPTHISCLHLKDVVFFQSPLYLSDLGMKISNKIESFIYLDKEDPDMTTKILLKANKIGIDFWTSAVSKSNPKATVFDDDLVWHLLKSHESKLPIISNQTILSRNARFLKRYKELHPELSWLDSSHQALIQFTSEGVQIFHPLLGSKKELAHLIFYRLGQESYLQQVASEFPTFENKKCDIIHLIELDLKQEFNLDLKFKTILFDDKKGL